MDHPDPAPDTDPDTGNAAAGLFGSDPTTPEPKTPMSKKTDPDTNTDLTVPAGGFLVLCDDEAAEMIAEAAPAPSDLQKLLVPSGKGGAAFVIETLEGEEFTKSLDVVLAYESPIERAFFATKMGEGESGPPHCSSPDGKVGFGVRDVEAIASATSVEDLIGSEQDCADCEFSKFGSNLEGGKGQACKQKVRLVVFSDENLLPMVLQIPSASLKGFKQFKMKLLNGRKRLSRVVTRLSLTKVVASPEYYRVEFAYVRDLGSEEMTKLAGLAKVLSDAAVQ